MLANSAKSNQPFVIIIIVLFGFALWFFTLINPTTTNLPDPSSGMPLFYFIFNILSNNIFLPYIFAFLLIIIQSLFLVSFNQKFILINNRTYLPALFYILITCSYIPIQKLTAVLIGGFFLFFALNYIYRTYRSDYALNEIFISGFFTALASLFWFPFSFFVVLLFIALIILRSFNFREWLVGLVGFLTPWLFVFVFYFVFRSQTQLSLFIENIQKGIASKDHFVDIQIEYIILYSFIMFITILASINILRNYQNKKIKTRKYFEINWWYFIIGLLVFVAFKKSSIEIIFVLSIPISFLLSEYFYTVKKSWFLNGILLIIYSTIIFIQIKAHLN